MVAPDETASLLGSQFDGKQCVSSLSHLCLVSHSLGAIRWYSRLLSFCVSFLILTQILISINWVFALFLKMVGDFIANKLSKMIHGLIRLGSFPESWQFTNVTAINKGVPSPDRENYLSISITPFCVRCMRSYFLRNSPVFSRNTFFYLLLSLLVGNVSSCIDALANHNSLPSAVLRLGWRLILFSFTLVQPSME